MLFLLKHRCKDNIFLADMKFAGFFRLSFICISVFSGRDKAGFLVKAGVALLPAPLQAVAVNAAKAFMELYPVKHIHETQLRIERAGKVSGLHPVTNQRLRQSFYRKRSRCCYLYLCGNLFLHHLHPRACLSVFHKAQNVRPRCKTGQVDLRPCAVD